MMSQSPSRPRSHQDRPHHHRQSQQHYSSRKEPRLLTLWKERQRRNAPRMQGTEAKALQELARNQAAFKYPACGFEHKIECSLLYAMISAPDTYPKQVVQAMVDEEDFAQYMYTAATTTTQNSSSSSNNNKEGEAATAVGEVNYAQLSAILNYSAEMNPSATNTHSENDNTINSNSTTNNDDKEDLSVCQKLCKKVLQTVIRYASEHDLDRETELDELLQPVKRVSAERRDRNDLSAILPLYIGYSAALMTGNPLPLLVGAVGMAAAPDNRQELKSVRHIVTQTDRVADVEKAGLLDEDY